MTLPFHIRPATPADAEAIACLHTANWRNAYRGIYSDAFLKKDATLFNRERWQRRFEELDPSSWTAILAEEEKEGEEGRLAGFACVLRRDERWGYLLDNFHVREDLRGRGLGRLLIGEAASWIAAREAEAPMHLFVFEANRNSRRFYDGIGGKMIERLETETPDGGRAWWLRYLWEPAAMLARR